MTDKIAFLDLAGDLAGQRLPPPVAEDLVGASGGGPATAQAIGFEPHAVGAQLQGRAVAQQAIGPRDAEAASPLPGTATVRQQRVFLDAYWVTRLHRLDRRIGQVLRRVGNGLYTVPVRPATPRAADHVDNDEGGLVGPIAANTDHRIAALPGGRHTMRNDLAQGTQHGVENPISGQRPRRAGRRHDGVEDRRFGRLDVDAAEDAGVIRNIPLQDRAHAEVGAGIGIGLRGVERRVDLGRGSLIIDEQAVAIDGDGDLNWQRLLADAVVVDVVGKAVSAVRPSGNLAARHALRVVEEFGEIIPCGVGTVSLEQFSELPGTHLAGRVLGFQVSEHEIGDAHVCLDKGAQHRVHDATLEKLERRDSQALLEYLRRIAGVRAGNAPTDIGMVTNHYAETL